MSVVNLRKAVAHLNVGFIMSECESTIGEISSAMDQVQKNPLRQVPWPAYPYRPEVHFGVAYNGSCIFLKYFVNEKSIRAAHHKPNEAVCEDSCVEFFISVEDERAYYNFEFNCIGAALVGYGETKAGRVLLPASVVDRIRCQALIAKNPATGDIHWELTIAIPFNVFCYHQLQSFNGKTCSANFYKCGDLLPVPHYVTWSDIDNPVPDFHLPEFFGALYFI